MAATSADSASQEAGRYVYCIAPGDEEVSLGEIGIEGRRVYTVIQKDICALVHDCPPQPYQSGNAELAAAWVLAHHRVVETAWKRWGTVLPLAFNTIVRAEQSSAEENLKVWLETERETFKGKLEALAGKAEYGLQLFWDVAFFARQLSETSPEIRELEEEAKSKPRGLAYMYRQKLENLLKREVEVKAQELFEDLYGRLSRCVNNIHIEKTKEGEEGRPMLANLSCLVSRERHPEFLAELDRMAASEGLSLRLTGPFPPYSFC